MKAKAIIFPKLGEVSVVELEVPPPQRHEIQIRTRYSTVSAGTESWILRNLLSWSPTRFPCVPGYQRSGTVTAVGPGVSGWQVGDHALAVTGSWADKEVARAFGGHIAAANVPTAFAYHVADHVDDLSAASAMVAQVGYSAASRANVTAGDWVLVVGDGLVGQCSAQAARALGARAILVGHRPDRLKLAEQFSADVVINARVENVPMAVRQAVGAQGVRVAIDSIQAVDSQRQYIDLLEPGLGQVVCNGFNPDDHWANVGLLQRRQLTTHFVLHWTRERMEATLAQMQAGKMCVAPLITHVVPFSRAPEMYRMIAERQQPFLGVAFDWRAA
ncbi:NAD(P)H quinone oxidoreductase [Steroidobacter agaridevorans]|uniref:NAD(P)H quinone oxidoreductase n=1 Tax=Steroidobacter agaridevorans TaxID=2695856 RepID=A0A829YJF7_9GAMM|nr:zinc-binding dehydrogenase [Steroidobacter agaridevorans]GFE83415.1 NAD(P)H quinone oxidoreductase [Steroidobacter agaridevorans]